MFLQPVTKYGPDSAAMHGESQPVLHINLSSGQYNLIYTPASFSFSWLTPTGKNGIVFTLGIPVDHLHHFAQSILSLSAVSIAICNFPIC